MSFLEYLQNDRLRLVLILIVMGLALNAYFMYSKFVALHRSQMAALEK